MADVQSMQVRVSKAATISPTRSRTAVTKIRAYPSPIQGLIFISRTNTSCDSKGYMAWVLLVEHAQPKATDDQTLLDTVCLALDGSRAESAHRCAANNTACN